MNAVYKFSPMEPPSFWKIVLIVSGIFGGIMALLVLLILAFSKINKEPEEHTRQQTAAEQRENDDAIKRHHILEGMTPDQVRQSWGQPRRIIHTQTGNADAEEWFYGGIGNEAVLVFRDGTLQSVTRDTLNRAMKAGNLRDGR